jgi:hypothetical protein
MAPIRGVCVRTNDEDDSVLWCPRHKATRHHFERRRMITVQDVKAVIRTIDGIDIVARTEYQKLVPTKHRQIGVSFRTLPLVVNPNWFSEFRQATFYRTLSTRSLQRCERMEFNRDESRHGGVQSLLTIH